MASEKPGRVVFIGNIPYGLTEEQIVHILSSVGQVLNFRLVYDNDTGRPKGFGFAEFNDTDAAASAVRNLNNHEVMGRQLRVDFSHVGGKDDKEDKGADRSQAQQPAAISNGFNAPASDSVQVNGLPPLPPGVDLAPNLTCPDAISKTLSTLPSPQLLDILSQMKGLVMGDPAKATELLRQAPQLSYAIFQALLLMGLVDSSALTSVISENTQPQHSQQPHQLPPPPPQQQRPTPLSYQQHQQQQPQYGQYPAAPPPPQHLQGPPMNHHVPTPPVQAAMYQPPQPQQQPPPQPQPPPQMDQNLMNQVLAMPQQQIDMLPPTERAQLMALKQSLMSGARF